MLGNQIVNFTSGKIANLEFKLRPDAGNIKLIGQLIDVEKQGFQKGSLRLFFYWNEKN